MRISAALVFFALISSTPPSLANTAPTNAQQHSHCTPDARVQLPVKDVANLLTRHTVPLTRGTTLGDVLLPYDGVSLDAFYRLTEQSKDRAFLNTLPGGVAAEIWLARDTCTFYEAILPEGKNAARFLHITKNNQTLATQWVTQALKARARKVTFAVENSLFLDGGKAGLSDLLIVALEDIFAGRMDFSRELYAGDQFTVWVNTYHLANPQKSTTTTTHTRPVREQLYAVEYTSQYRAPIFALRYTPHNPTMRTAYFDEAGKNMKAAFIRNPVKFTRISSRFNPRRLHPILKVVRPHRGVDFAAPTGTPVRAASDGVVKTKTYSRSYGNYLVVQHGRRYETVYGHLSKFARNIREGARVARGQTIGYVGSTGLSTGPHLHYELRVDGRHVDPLRATLPTTQALPKTERARFNAVLAARKATLATASNSKPPHKSITAPPRAFTLSAHPTISLPAASQQHTPH